ncbi:MULTISPECIES: hypothetical protein [Streptomyces]|uniref:hypothetical protein n=1 Tax=Streptomyces TaxID=1883 RepID=UPI000B217906|nr:MULTISPECIES: hypothetical protein [Streptomyces]MDP9953142.1 hypothetical protein [Streptomyces sp. DSM 41269]
MTTKDVESRFVVEKHGRGSFYVFDKTTGLSRYPSFTRRGAQKIADRKNAECTTGGTR